MGRDDIIIVLQELSMIDRKYHTTKQIRSALISKGLFAPGYANTLYLLNTMVREGIIEMEQPPSSCLQSWTRRFRYKQSEEGVC